MLKGYKTKIAVVLIALGGLGAAIQSGDLSLAVRPILEALAIFGLYDRLNRLDQ